jgi:hypothetical protein
MNSQKERAHEDTQRLKDEIAERKATSEYQRKREQDEAISEYHRARGIADSEIEANRSVKQRLHEDEIEYECLERDNYAKESEHRKKEKRELDNAQRLANHERKVEDARCMKADREARRFLEREDEKIESTKADIEFKRRKNLNDEAEQRKTIHKVKVDEAQFMKAQKEAQLQNDSEHQKNSFGDGKAYSEYAHAQQLESEKKRRQEVHERKVEEARILKTERDARYNTELEGNKIEANKAAIDYRHHRKVNAEAKQREIDHEIKVAEAQFMKAEREAQLQNEAEHQNISIESRKKSSEFVRVKQLESKKMQRQALHERKAEDARRLKAERDARRDASELEIDQIEENKAAIEYRRRQKVNSEGKQREIDHNINVSEAQHIKAEREAQVQNETEHQKISIETGKEYSEYAHAQQLKSEKKRRQEVHERKVEEARLLKAERDARIDVKMKSDQIESNKASSDYLHKKDKEVKESLREAEHDRKVEESRYYKVDRERDAQLEADFNRHEVEVYQADSEHRKAHSAFERKEMAKQKHEATMAFVQSSRAHKAMISESSDAAEKARIVEFAKTVEYKKQVQFI